MTITVRQATLEDLAIVSDILWEAAQWLEQKGMPLWNKDEVCPNTIYPDVIAGLYYLAFHDNTPAAVVRFQLEDPQFWSDISQTDSAFLHRLAVRRTFAGGTVVTELLNWAVAHARCLGKRYLRLDCAFDRVHLRLRYERFGFRHHSDRQVGPYFVARYDYQL